MVASIKPRDFHGFSIVMLNYQSVLGIIIPIDAFIFFRGVGIPPTSKIIIPIDALIFSEG